MSIMKYCKKRIAEDTGAYYRLEGDDFWYKKVIGPGYDVPVTMIGPRNKNINPRIINQGELSGLIKRLKNTR